VFDDELRGPSLLFRVRARLCALPLAHVVETMRPLPVEPMLRAPPCVRGLAIIRGSPVAVVDVSRLLGDDSAADHTPPTARFVTVKVGGRAIALAVDEVIGARSLELDSLAELPPLLHDADVDVVSAIGTHDAELLLVLRGARLVSESVDGAEGPS
jgi:purine-binding chemotaxis protein CheW